VGKGIGNRGYDFKKRGRGWKKYVKQFKGDPKVLIVKKNLTAQRAEELEQKLINKCGSIIVGGTLVNTKGIGFDPYNSIVLSLEETREEYDIDSKYEDWSDEAIIVDLLDFPNEKKATEIYEKYDELNEFYNQFYDQIEEQNDYLTYEIDELLNEYEALIVDLQSSAIDKIQFKKHLSSLLDDFAKFKQENSKRLIPEAILVLSRLEEQLRMAWNMLDE